MIFDNYKDVLKDAGYGEQWWIGKEEFPVKVALVGDAVKGYTKWVASKKFACDPKDKEAKFNFAINAWDGSTCRKLEGTSGLFGQLGKVHESTAGLQHIWVEVGKEGNRYYAKYAGDLTEADKTAIAAADQVDLLDKCDWAEIV